MPYILNKTDGSIVGTVQDAGLDQNTDLTFVGRNFAGYGEIQNENFLKLLENFSNLTPPPKPIEGQLWFDKSIDNKKLNIYDGSNWKSVANLEVSDQDPFTRNINRKSPKEGDLWYDTQAGQLYVFNGGQYVLIGPAVGADTQAGWRGDADRNPNQGEIRNFNSKAVIGADNDVVAIISALEYPVVPTDPADFTKYRGSYQRIFRGITLNGTDDNGVSYTGQENQPILWGTSSHSLKSNTSTSALNVFTTEVSNSSVHYIPFVSSRSGNSNPHTHINLTYTPSGTEGTLKSGIFDGTATRARYADLAERYESDQPYEFGTVVVIGGDKEITASTYRADTAVAGVISQNPGYMMNSQAGSDETHPYIALKGRVFCKVSGKINKGDLLVTSNLKGHAESWKEGDSHCAVFARALQDFAGESGLIEVKV